MKMNQFAAATITVCTIASWAVAQDRTTQILQPEWNSGLTPVAITLPNGNKSDVLANVFGKQDVEQARDFGAKLVREHNSKSIDEQKMNKEAVRRFGDTAFARFFVFESKVGFSLEVRKER
jgi:hypothetical protein